MVNGSTVLSPAGELGERLIRSGMLSEQQLELARREERRRSATLSKVLVDLGLVPAEKLSEFLARQAGAEYVDLGSVKVERAALELLPYDVARRLCVLPIAHADGVLTLAMADPCNVVAIDTVRQIAGTQIHVVVATERDILSRLDTLEAHQTSIQESIDQIIEDRDREAQLFGVQAAAAQEATPGKDQDAPTIRLVSQIISRAVAKGASDIHFQPEQRLMRVRMRVDGILHQDVLVPKALQSLVIARMKILGDLDVSENRLPQDGRATVTLGRREYHLRVSCLPCAHGESVVVRILNSSATRLQLATLGMSAQVEEELSQALAVPYGVIIVTGPTGSGKTTTLYAILNEINSPDLSIFTLEDPIEFRMAGIRQTQIREDIGLTFGAGLRSLLRQDPDVMLVGETRDTETAQLMVRAALTGHLALTTLHTNDAPGAIPRLLDMGVEPYLLPDSLIAILAQRLVRRLCPACREPVKDPERVIEELRVHPPADRPLKLWQPGKCEACDGTGFRGRQGIFELMMIDGRFHDAIVRRAGAPAFAELARQAGMQTMFQDGLRQAMEGVTTVQEVLGVIRSVPE